MRCQACGSETAADFAFCPRCGNTLQAACPSCGFDCPADFAFCPKCGARVESSSGTSGPPVTSGGAPKPSVEAPNASDSSASGPGVGASGGHEGERRPVTIVFADLSGFTALSETLDPEDLAALVDRCLQAMADTVYRFEGTVDKYIGDCVMALFGAPVAHENDPERAILAALDMRERVAEVSQAVEHTITASAGQLGPLLSLHTGINTGIVVAGAVGDARRRDYTVLGDAVNVASRLGSVAALGEIVVGEATYRLTRHAFAFEPLGGVSVKGRSEPVGAYRVVRALGGQRSMRGLEVFGLSAPLVGRDDELRQLSTAFDRMVEGHTRVVSVVGEAGSGKSRLVRELLDRLERAGRLEAAGVQVRTTACSSMGEPTYGVLAGIFRDAYGLSNDDPTELTHRKVVAGLMALGTPASELERHAALVTRVLGISQESPELDWVEPEQRKRQLYLVVRAILDLRLRHGPLVLIVEDLHWADAASVELLRLLVDRLGDRAFMLLATQRPGLDGGPTFGDEPGTTVVRLGPLTNEHGRAVIESFFGASTDRVTATVRDLVVTQAGGNPFYLEEIVRALIESGDLAVGPGGWSCVSDVGALRVPGTLEGLLVARLDRLRAGARRLFHEASVLGPVFDARLLGAICSEPRSLDGHLALLRAAELIEELPWATDGDEAAPRRFRATHPMIRDVAYQTTLVRRRIELHGRAGTALELMLGGQSPHLEDVEALGHHFSLSQDKLKGARYLVEAGDWARAMFANEDAANHYRRALDALSGCDPVGCRSERMSAHEALADVLGAAGQRQAALDQYAIVLVMHEQDRNSSRQASVLRKIGSLHSEAGDREVAMTHYQSGLKLLDGRPPEIEHARLHQEIGRLSFRNGDHARAIDCANTALTIAESIHAVTSSDRKQAVAAAALALNTLGIARARSGDLAGAVADLERALKVAQADELLEAASRVYSNLAVVYSTLDPGKAIDTCLAGLDLAKRIGEVSLQPWLYATLAGAYCTFTGQCEEDGIAAAHAAIELDRQLGQLDHLAVPLIVLAQIYQCHGQASRSLEYYQEALQIAKQMGEAQLLIPCYDGLATLYLELGDDARAEELMLTGQQICEQAGLDPDSLVVLPFLG